MILLTAMMAAIAFAGPWKTSSTLMQLDQFGRPVAQTGEADLFALSGNEVPGFAGVNARFRVTFAEVDELPRGIKSSKERITTLKDGTRLIEVMANEGKAPKLLHVRQNPVPFRFFASEHFLYAYLPGNRFVPIAQLAAISEGVPVRINVSEPVIVSGEWEQIVVSRTVTIEETVTIEKNKESLSSRTFECVFHQNFGGLFVYFRDAKNQKILLMSDYQNRSKVDVNDFIVGELRSQLTDSKILEVRSNELGAALEYAYFRFKKIPGFLTAHLTKSELELALRPLFRGMRQYAALEGFPNQIEIPETQELRLFSNPCGYSEGNIGVGPEYLSLANSTFLAL